MRLTFAVVSCLFISQLLNAQKKNSFTYEIQTVQLETVNSDSVIYTLVENMPVYDSICLTLKANKVEDCSKSLWYNYVSTITTPENVLKKREKATVFCKFIVEKDGSINNVNILRSSGFEKLDNAVINHLKLMPKFHKPGYQRGNAVRVKYSFPIYFKG